MAFAWCRIFTAKLVLDKDAVEVTLVDLFAGVPDEEECLEGTESDAVLIDNRSDFTAADKCHQQNDRCEGSMPTTSRMYQRKGVSECFLRSVKVGGNAK